MSQLHIPGEVGKVSDGYHTFDDLYEHRNVLFLALMRERPDTSWIAESHDDGSMYENWFIAGTQTPEGDVTYHLPSDLWQIALCTGCRVLKKAPKWDGHTPENVIARLVRLVMQSDRKITDKESEENPT